MLFNGRATDAIRERPPCDVCKGMQTQPAAVDAVGLLGGRARWAYMCIGHHLAFGGGKLGQAVGQVLLCGDDYDDELKEYYDLEEPNAA